MPEGRGEGGSRRGGTVDQTPGKIPSLSQLDGAGLQPHCEGGMDYFGRETAEQRGAEGRWGRRRPRGQKMD